MHIFYLSVFVSLFHPFSLSLSLAFSLSLSLSLFSSPSLSIYLSLSPTQVFIYPRLFSIHDMGDEVGLPSDNAEEEGACVLHILRVFRIVIKKVFAIFSI